MPLNILLYLMGSIPFLAHCTYFIFALGNKGVSGKCAMSAPVVT